MKLIIEKHPELIRLNNCFQKIEALAEKMGVDVDELVTEQKNRRPGFYSTRKNLFISGKNCIESFAKNSSKSLAKNEKYNTLLHILNNKK